MVLKTFLAVVSVICCFGAPALCYMKEAYFWRTLTFDLPSQQDEDSFSKLGTYVPEYTLPISMDVYKEKLFMTLLNILDGTTVPVSMVYINMSDITRPPRMHPYPSLRAYQSAPGKSAKIREAYKLRVDRCERLWVLEISNSTDDDYQINLLAYDLKTDLLLRDAIAVPSEHILNDTVLSNLAVDDANCDDTYVYIGDLSTAALIVYSSKSNRFWRVKHQFFEADKDVKVVDIDGETVHVNDGLTGLAPEGGTLFFHPWSSTHEFSISTAVVNNETWVASDDGAQAFHIVGSRGVYGSGSKPQAGAAVVDRKSGVMFYASTDVVSCWRTRMPFTPESQGVVHRTRNGLHPMDVRMDAEGRVWALFTPFFLSKPKVLNPRSVNVIVYRARVEEAINGTVCSTGSVSAVTTSHVANGVWLALSIVLVLFHS